MNVKYLKSKQVMFLVCKAKNEKWNYQIVCIDFRGIGIVRRIRSSILSKGCVNPIYKKKSRNASIKPSADLVPRQGQVSHYFVLFSGNSKYTYYFLEYRVDMGK
jgi:hypothetical protein